MNILFGVFSTRDDLPEVLKSISKDFNILNHMIMTANKLNVVRKGEA